MRVCVCACLCKQHTETWQHRIGSAVPECQLLVIDFMILQLWQHRNAVPPSQHTHTHTHSHVTPSCKSYRVGGGGGGSGEGGIVVSEMEWFGILLKHMALVTINNV
eukprot:GHVQ01036993.1.p3 GENE.GHVQ01036993.1~~GHVQ01036993.1.p3  ORF type:complete len:106 (-),score=30.28 GHVQ01036993.1:15-332(-)